MPRFQVLAGRHYQNERLKSGVVSEREYSANDATCNIVDTADSVDGPIDLEARYNQQGFSEKFRRLPEVAEELQAVNGDDFYKEAVRRGLIKDGAAANPQAVNAPAAATVAAVKHEEPKPSAAKLPPHPALANLNKMPLVGMQKLAEDEEIDVAGKNEQQTRDAVRKALEARSK